MSNISIVYGYGFDNEDGDLDNDDIEKIENSLPNVMMLQGQYSVGAFDPAGFVIGIEVQDIGMFWATELKNTLTPENKAIMDAWKMPPELAKIAVTNKDHPVFLVHGYTDD